MKPPLSAATLAYAAVASAVVPTEATKRSPAIYAYCMGCTEWKDSAPNENGDSSLQVVVKTTVSTSAFRSEFIPWPTTVSRQELLSPSLVEDLNLKEKRLLEVDSNAQNMQLVITKAATYSLLSGSILPKQQSGEEFFLLLLLIVAAIVLAYGEKGEKLSSSGSDKDDFRLIELTPTIDEEGDEQDDDSDLRNIQTKSILLGSISSGGKCVVKSKTKKRVHFQEEPLQEEDYRKEGDEVCNSPVPYHDYNGSSPSRYTCNNTFQDKLSGNILKFLLNHHEEKHNEISKVISSLPNNVQRGDEQQKNPQDIPSSTLLDKYESDRSESGSADSSMLNEYEDFLFQVKQSFL